MQSIQAHLLESLYTSLCLCLFHDRGKVADVQLWNWLSIEKIRLKSSLWYIKENSLRELFLCIEPLHNKETLILKSDQFQVDFLEYFNVQGCENGSYT